MPWRIAKWAGGVVGAVAFGLTAWAKSPAEDEIIPVQVPATPQPRPATQPQPVPATPTRPATPPARPTTPINLQGGTGTQTAAAGTSARPVELPNMYGDIGGFFNFSPYTQAHVPAGQVVTLPPGQTQFFPAGTTFNRTVTGLGILTTGTFVPVPNVPYPPGYLEKLGASTRLAGATVVAGQRSSTDILVTGQNPQIASGALPLNTVRGAFKISENESPRPVDRVYVTYNFFNDVNQGIRVPGQQVIDIHRQTFGIEKVFLGGDASIGLRLPLLQVSGPTELARSTVGDLSIVTKFALINNPFEPTTDGTIRGGQVLSTGLVVTAPTGGAAAFSAQDPQIHPTVLQPYVGGIMTFPRAYLQGFTSISIPTDSRDTIYFMKSVQFGYLLYRDPLGTGLVTSVTPLAELHIDTPLNNRGIDRLPVGAYDVVSFTVGTTFGLGRRSFLNIGANAPVTGPKPYAVEAMAHLNILY